jgi:hypothetical protein
VDYNLEDSKIINMPHEERKIRWKKDGWVRGGGDIQLMWLWWFWKIICRNSLTKRF